MLVDQAQLHGRLGALGLKLKVCVPLMLGPSNCCYLAGWDRRHDRRTIERHVDVL